MKKLGLAVVLAFAPAAYAADIAAGKAKVAQVCSACHGMNGVSVTDTIPNLAAQRAGYIEAQLKAFKDGLRRPASPTSPKYPRIGTVSPSGKVGRASVSSMASAASRVVITAALDASTAVPGP